MEPKSGVVQEYIQDERAKVLLDLASSLLLSDNPRETLDAVFKKLSAHLGLEVFFIYLVTEDGGRLRLYDYAGIPEQTAREIEWLDYGQAICGCVARDKERIIAEDVQCSADPGTGFIRSLGITAFCCHPLIAHDRLIGVLSFGTRNRARFAGDEIELIHAVSNLIAPALERKRADESLKLTQFALDNFCDSAIWLALDGRIVYVNQEACKSLGYSREELLSMRIWDIDAEYPEEKFRELWRGGGQPGFTVKFESRHIARDGRVFPVEVTACYTRFGDKEYLVTFDRDITERKRAGEAMRESEKRYHSLFQHMIEGLANCKMLYDGLDHPVDFVYLSVNDAFGRLTGLENVEGKRATELFPGIGELHPELLEIYGRVASTGRPEKFEIKFKPLSLWLSVAAYSTEKGCFTAIFEDITERKRAEGALRESRSVLEAELEDTKLLQSISAELLHEDNTQELFEKIIDAAMRIMRSEFASMQVLYPERGSGGELRLLAFRGFSPEAAKFWKWVGISGGSTCGEALRKHRRVIMPDVEECGYLRGTEDLAVYRQTGIRACQTTPLISRNGKLVGMISTHWRSRHEPSERDLRLWDILVRQAADLIERARAEEALLAAKQQAELYLDLMGHDINNMHQVALGYLELARELPAGEKQAEFLDKSIEVLQRSTKLIGNVRKLQKLHEGAFQNQDVDVCRVLADIKSEYGAVAGKKIALSMDGHGRCIVHANELLHDVFSNLVNNAVKHTGDAAEVSMVLDTSANGGRFIRVSVEDNGPGIPDDAKERIFNRMHKGTARGMGLGLYLVKSLVNSYGGRVWVEDRVKGDHTRGARFVVVLPAVEK